MSFIVQPQTLLAIGPSRSFGATGNIFKGYVTITENTTDAIEITQQPVQQGASIADHAFKKPITFSCQIRFQASVLPGLSLTSGITGPQSLSAIYQQLLNLQQSFVPVTCTTPKRTLTNMLITALGVTTDKSTENVLSVNISFQQIITVPLVIGQINAANLKNKANASTQTVGQKSSTLASLKQGAQIVLGGK